MANCHEKFNDKICKLAGILKVEGGNPIYPLVCSRMLVCLGMLLLFFNVFFVSNNVAYIILFNSGINLVQVIITMRLFLMLPIPL